MSVCKRQAKSSLYYLSFCDRKNNTQQKFISCFDIVVVNDNLLRHTRAFRIPHFISLLQIIKKQKSAAFFTMGRNSQVSNQHMDNTTCSEQMRSAVLYCKAALLHQEPLLSLLLQGNCIYDPSSGTGHFSCILAELCWLKQFPLLALLPVHPHLWERKGRWKWCYLSCCIPGSVELSFPLGDKKDL